MEESKKLWFQKSIEEIEKKFEVNQGQGLSEEQVKKNREIYGSNELEAKKKKSLFSSFINYRNFYFWSIFLN